MGKFQLGFGIHNHQPIGNFEAVFDEAHQRAYLPFLKLIDNHPGLRLSLHQSGILWRWQEQRQPEFFELVGKLVDAGRIELMTGGFYEPILTSIPERDSIGQIDMLTGFLQNHFEVEPTGLWLTERVWEPHLPRLLSQAGVKYLPIDDTHFIYAGFQPHQLTGAFITEHEGHAVTLLPIQKRLRYLIPYGSPEEVIEHLKRQASENPDGCAVYADDGEKFGVWPGSHEHCYTDAWLERFFRLVEDNADWLEMSPLGKVAEKVIGRAYLPSASYDEMLHWALPARAFEGLEEFRRYLQDEHQFAKFWRFVRGGHWRGFLAKYDEANLMHKRMLYVSRQLEAFESQHLDRRQETARVRDRLYASQCNCPYWHGVFGGLYLPHIRQAVYAAMIEAEAKLRVLRGKDGVTCEVGDFDYDGRQDVRLDTDRLSLLLRPFVGGSLTELALYDHNFLLTDTLSRRREGYHQQLRRGKQNGCNDRSNSKHTRVSVKEEGLENYLEEDWYLRRCFIDHFFGASVNIDQFAAGSYEEEGDFAIEPYDFDIRDNGASARLMRNGHLWRADGVVPVRIVKTIEVKPKSDQFTVTYELSAPGSEGVEVNFGLENNFTFQAGHAEDRYVMIDSERPEDAYLDSTGTSEGAHSLTMVDDYRSLAVSIDARQPAEIWRLPIFTVSLSEGGFERVYQGTSVIHRYRLTLTTKPTQLVFSVAAGSKPAVLSILHRARPASERL